MWKQTQNVDVSRTTVPPRVPGLLQRKCDCGQNTIGGAECSECRKQETHLRRSALTHNSGNAVPGIVHDVLRSPGKPIDHATRAFMGSRFGHDLSQVRVHTDSTAAESARQVQASAYTVGQNIVFGAGRYQPHSTAGSKLLAHELAHTIQQSTDARLALSSPLRVSNPDDALERDADAQANAVLSGARMTSHKHVAPTIARSVVEPASTKPTVESVEVQVQPVSIADDDGKNPTTVPSFASAKAIWGKCCMTLKVLGTKTVNKASYKVLDEDPTTDTYSPTVEEKALMTDAGAGGGIISVIVPQMFKNGADVSKKILGGGVTYMPNMANATSFLVEGSDPTNVAHELGHTMGNGSHDPDTVMAGSGAYNKPNLEKVSEKICGKVKAFAYGKASGKSDCTVTTP